MLKRDLAVDAEGIGGNRDLLTRRLVGQGLEGPENGAVCGIDGLNRHGLTNLMLL